MNKQELLTDHARRITHQASSIQNALRLKQEEILKEHINSIREHCRKMLNILDGIPEPKPRVHPLLCGCQVCYDARTAKENERAQRIQHHA